MENQFLLAIALWESRRTMTRFFPGRTHCQSPPEVEKPIDWGLLVDDSATSQGRQDRSSAKTAEHSRLLSQPLTGELASTSVSSRVLCGRES